jgi:hypothetical protein
MYELQSTKAYLVLRPFMAVMKYNIAADRNIWGVGKRESFDSYRNTVHWNSGGKMKQCSSQCAVSVLS